MLVLLSSPFGKTKQITKCHQSTKALNLIKRIWCKIGVLVLWRQNLLSALMFGFKSGGNSEIKIQRMREIIFDETSKH